ncbi:MAG: ROK family protein [Planctomycetota bacterium]|nr:MAG: ROK family protein [Planctomycetota bacterium]
MTVNPGRPSGVAIGIDLGGTKCAGALVQFPDGNVLSSQVQPTHAERGGVALLADVKALARSLERDADRAKLAPAAVGIGVAELVGRDGRVQSAATIRWEGVDVAAELHQATGLPATVDADVRAAARAEAALGAGRRYRNFLYVTVGTGISACLVLEGVPYEGASGMTGTFASSRTLVPADDGRLASGPPLEQFAAGPALASRYAAALAGFRGAAHDVLASAAAGEPTARSIVSTAGEALGAAIGQLVNVLDPEAVVLGGGLGLAIGLYRDAIDAAMRRHIWASWRRDLPLTSAELGVHAGVVGAALGALEAARGTRR